MTAVNKELSKQRDQSNYVVIKDAGVHLFIFYYPNWSVKQLYK